jgi:pyruvate dehydrogenase phosphatase
LDEDSQYRLLLCSDGFVDQYFTRLQGSAPTSANLELLAARWIETLAQKPHADNAALYLLRDSLGGSNLDMVSAYTTVEMMERWMDDTTILVQSIR